MCQKASHRPAACWEWGEWERACSENVDLASVKFMMDNFKKCPQARTGGGTLYFLALLHSLLRGDTNETAPFYPRHFLCLGQSKATAVHPSFPPLPCLTVLNLSLTSLLLLLLLICRTVLQLH